MDDYLSPLISINLHCPLIAPLLPLLHPGLEIMYPIPLFMASIYLFRPYKEMTPTPKSNRKLSFQ